MSLIVKSGYLRVNREHGYARIVYSNGNESQALATKRQALEIGEALYGTGLIGSDEWKIIRQQIHECPLIDKNKVLEEVCNRLQGDLEELKRQIEKNIRAHRHTDDDGEGWRMGL